MKIIANLDRNDYQGLSKVFKRIAVKAIIFKDNKLAMIQSDKYHEYKFPGGGAHKNETHEETLMREVLEETGLTVDKNTIKPFGVIMEKHLSTVNRDEIFYMESFYYFCNITNDKAKPQVLDPYEKEYGYQLVFENINVIIKENEKLVETCNDTLPWIKRELNVLYLLKDEWKFIFFIKVIV